ncbi:flagellar brake protein [Pseudoalteromonas fenneropenaei]|uniref:Flagellar brake protein n=1 Tax=Pseudoalteromonas fenneropenaei TaxID=1737459 RepID=A0ABV7CL01_9GAMM
MIKTVVAGSQQYISQLQSGVSIDLEIIMPATSKRVKTEYIGQLADQFIVLNHPNPKRLGAALDYLKEGSTVVVRALLEQSGGEIIAFKEQIKAVTVHPARLIFLYFPDRIQLMCLRNHARIPTLIPAVLSQGEFATVGVIKDISVAGLLIDVSEAQLPADFKERTCHILIEGKEGDKTTLSGQVCSLKRQGETIHLGIKLLSDKQQMDKVLREYLIDLSALEEVGGTLHK